MQIHCGGSSTKNWECKYLNQHFGKISRSTCHHDSWCLVRGCTVYGVWGLWWEILFCKVNGACEATLWMKRMVRGDAGSLLFNPSPSRAVCNAAVPFHTLVQFVPYFILSVHTAPLETNYTANYTCKGSDLLSIWIPSRQKRQLLLLYTVCSLIHCIVHTHTLSALLVLFTWCLLSTVYA